MNYCVNIQQNVPGVWFGQCRYTIKLHMRLPGSRFFTLLSRVERPHIIRKDGKLTEILSLRTACHISVFKFLL